MEIMPTIDIPSLSMGMAQSRVMEDFGVAMLDMSLESAASQGDALSDIMRSSMELSVNPDIGGNIDISI